MTAPRSVHHINFIYRDLDAAVAHFARLGLGPFEYEDLEARGVRTARVDLGGTWIVLVSPTRPSTGPAEFLATHGEGFFLLSFGVDDLAAAIDALAAGEAPLAVGPPRAGLDGWRVADLVDARARLGIELQLAEEAD